MRKIDNYEHYYITEDGEVYSNSSGRLRRRKTQINNHGYETVDLCKDGECNRFLVHRLVATYFLGNPKEHDVVNHKDSNPQNNNVTNLEWCTRSYNSIHAYEKGRLPKPPLRHGEELSFSKLNNEDVQRIRELREEGETLESIARKFDVHLSTIGRVCNREIWKHI